MSEPKTLKEFFGVDELDFGEPKRQEIVKKTAHIIIDVQREFCDPEHERKRGNKETVHIAGFIAEKLAPKFRAAGMKTFFVYFSNDIDNPNVNKDCGGFYKVRPNKKDELVAKNTDCAFSSGGLFKSLRKAKVKNIIVSGFNANACVKSTVFGGLDREFNVCVLKDAIGNDNFNTRATLYETLNAMSRDGACIEKSNDVLTVVAKRKPATKKIKR